MKKALKTKKMLRPKKGRVVGGVCLALSNYFDIDVTIVRIIAVFLLIPGGIPGLLPYIICWFVIPSE